MTKLILKLSEPKSFLIIGVLYTLLITIAFISPGLKLQKIDVLLLLDKFVHVVVHLFLSGIWLSFYYLKTKKTITISSISIIVLLCITYGIVIEVYQQLFIASRQADLFDVLANSIGTFIGTMLFWKLKKKIYS